MDLCDRLRRMKVFTLTSYNFCISWNYEFVDLKWQCARWTVATRIRQPPIQSNNHSYCGFGSAHNRVTYPMRGLEIVRANIQMDTCYNEIGLRVQNIDNKLSSSIVHTIGRAYVIVQSDIKSSLWPPHNFFISSISKLEMTICIIHHNCWPDERVPDPIQPRSKLSVEVEVSSATYLKIMNVGYAHQNWK